MGVSGLCVLPGLQNREMVRLTDDQYKLVEAVENHSRLNCTGGAGTGKSLIAVQTAIEESKNGLSVEFVCRSAIFAEFVRGRLEQHGVAVNHLETIGDTPEQQHDCLIVDEAQDTDRLQFPLIGTPPRIQIGFNSH